MSIELRLGRGQRRRMKRTLRKTKSRIEALRARVLLLLHDRVPAAEVAHRVGCVRATVYRTVYRFEELGEDGLVDRRAHRQASKVTARVEELLLGYLDDVPGDYGWERPNWTLELLAKQLKRDSEVELSCSYLRRLEVAGLN